MAIRGRRLPAALAAVLAVGFVVLGLLQAWSDAPTYDEPVYISSGVVALHDHDLTINDEHPPPWKVLAILPVLAAHPAIPSGDRVLTEDGYAQAFMQAQRTVHRIRTIVFLSRLVPLAEAVLAGVLLCRLGVALFGRWAGLLAAALWWADPFVVGLAHLDGVDVPFTLAVLLVSWALLAAMRDPRPRHLWPLGAACGACVLANADGAVVALGAALVATAFGIQTRPAGTGPLRWMAGRLARVVGLAWLTVLAGYAVLDPASLWPLIVVPEPLVHGLRFLSTKNGQPAASYLLGHAWIGGQWWYWPVSAVVKIPWATLIVLAGGAACVGLGRPAQRIEAAALAVLPGLALAVLLLSDQRDIGLRYALPVLACGCLAGSAAVLLPARLAGARPAVAGGSRARLRAVRAGPGVAAAVVAGLVTVSAAQTAGSAPYSLAWVNPAFGPSYQAVTNSSGDWDQGFWLLRSWARGKHVDLAFADVWGAGDDLPGSRPLLGGFGDLTPLAPDQVGPWVAVSATALTSTAAGQLSWLRAYCPVRILGGTILVYHFEAAPSEAPGPVEPAGRCRGTVSVRPGTAPDRPGGGSGIGMGGSTPLGKTGP